MTESQKSHQNQQKTTDQARDEARKVGQDAQAQAAEIKDQAAQTAQQVAGHARVEAEQVVTEARDQVRGLIDTTLGEVRGRAAEGQTALAGTVRSLSQELQQLTQESSASGPVAQLAGDLAGRGDKLATWLGDKQPDDVLLEVRRFAARKPTTFLALAAGAGLLAGRLARGQRDLAQDEQQVQQIAQRPRVETYESYVHTEPVARPDGYREPGLGIDGGLR